MAVTEERKSYFREYYRANKERISRNRRERWKSDKPYRDQQNENRRVREQKPYRVEKRKQDAFPRKLTRLLGVGIVEARRMAAEIDRERAAKSVARGAGQDSRSDVGVSGERRGASVVESTVAGERADGGAGAELGADA